MKRISIALLLLLSLLGVNNLLGQSKPDPATVTLVTIGKDSISSEDFRIRFTFERFLREQQIKQIFDTYKSFGYTSDQLDQLLNNQQPYATWIRELQTPDSMGLRIINDMTNDLLTEQEAERLKLTINDADITHEIRALFGIPVDTDNMTADDKTKFQTDLKQSLDDLKEATGLEEKDIHPYFEALAYRTVVRNYLGKDISQLLYVHLRHILVANEAEAKDILKQLDAGKNFADLAKQYSTDTTSGANGGELDWVPVDNYVSEFADAVRQGHIGDIIGPVKTQFGYHIIDILGMENRVGTDNDIATIKYINFDRWLTTLRTNSEAKIKLLPSWIDSIPKLPAYTLPSDS